MANLATLRKTFDDYLISNWNRNQITWDNTSRSLTEDQEWIRPTLNLENSENVTIGGVNGHHRIRFNGSYIIQVFSSLNKGTGDIYRAVDDLNKLFNNKRLEENILTYTCQVDRIGDEGNGWYQINVSIPFTSDQLSTD